jgi:ABC-type sugar transport system ATPase subunit
VREGEILGLYGLVGAGRSEAAEAIFGLRAKTGGRFLWKGRPVDIRSAREAVELGIALVPEDRKRQGLVLEMLARENVSLALLRRLGQWGVLQRGRERSLFRDYVQRLRIKVASGSVKAVTLSGGNQQKLVLAKWIATNPRLLILDEPTRGVDVGAKAEIHAIVTRLAEAGMAVILISSEMPEVISLSHRVVTMYRGHVTDEVQQVDISEERLVAGVMNRGLAPRVDGQPRQAIAPPNAAE